MKKIFEAFFVDEYNNYWHLGFHGRIDEVIEPLNDFLKEYTDADTGERLHVDVVELYPCTFGEAFDKEFYADCGTVALRGFVYNADALMEELEEIGGEVLEKTKAVRRVKRVANKLNEVPYHTP